MEYSIRYCGDIVIIEFKEDIEVHNLTEFKKILDKVVAAETKVICNCICISCINNMGLAFLTGTVRRIRSRGGDLKLSNLSQDLIELSRIIRLDEVIEIYQDEEDAVEAFKMY